MQDLSAAKDIFIVESLIRQHLRRLRSQRYVRGSVSIDTFLPPLEGSPDRFARAVEAELELDEHRARLLLAIAQPPFLHFRRKHKGGHHT